MSLSQMLGQVCSSVVPHLTQMASIHGLVLRVNRLVVLLHGDLGSARELAILLGAFHLHLFVMDSYVRLYVPRGFTPVVAKFT